MKITTRLLALGLFAAAGMAHAQAVKPEISTPMGIVTAPEEVAVKPAAVEAKAKAEPEKTTTTSKKKVKSEVAKSKKPAKKTTGAKKAKIAKK